MKGLQVPARDKLREEQMCLLVSQTVTKTAYLRLRQQGLFFLALAPVNLLGTFPMQGTAAPSSILCGCDSGLSCRSFRRPAAARPGRCQCGGRRPSGSLAQNGGQTASRPSPKRHLHARSLSGLLKALIGICNS